MRKQFILSIIAALISQIATAGKTMNYLCESCDPLERKPVHYSWLIGQAPIKPAKALIRKSRKFQVHVSQNQLAAGMQLPHLAHSAVIKLTPMKASKAQTLIPQELMVISPSEKSYPVASASAHFADAKSLSESPYYAGEVITFQLKKELGAGRFKLKAITPGDQDYKVAIYDKNSPLELSLHTDKIHYLYGDRLKVTLELKDSVSNYAIDNIEANLISPQGENQTLTFSHDDKNTYIAFVTLNQTSTSEGRPYYINVSTDTDIEGTRVKREAKTAFSYAIPSANITQIERLPSLTEDLVISSTLDVATDSRYEIEGTLYGTADDGQLYPFMQAQSAEWLTRGEQTLKLYFDALPLSKTSLHKPYEIRHIRISDQAQLAPVAVSDQVIHID